MPVVSTNWCSSVHDPFAIGAGADQQQRVFGGTNHFGRLVQGLAAAGRAGAVRWAQTGERCRDARRRHLPAVRDERRRARSSLGEPEGFTRQAGDGVDVDNLLGELGDRLHHRDHVDDLKAALFRNLDRLLAGDHDHRHGAQLGVGGGGDEIRRTGAEGREADARLAGQSAVSGGHEAGALLVAGQDEFDFRGAQRIREDRDFPLRERRKYALRLHFPVPRQKCPMLSISLPNGMPDPPVNSAAAVKCMP